MVAVANMVFNWALAGVTVLLWISWTNTEILFHLKVRIKVQ